MGQKGGYQGNVVGKHVDLGIGGDQGPSSVPELRSDFVSSASATGQGPCRLGRSTNW